MKKPTEIQKLREEIAALRKEIEELKAAPRETHNHFHTHYGPPAAPITPEPWRPHQPYWQTTGSGVLISQETP